MRGAACARNVKSDNRIAAISPLYTAAAAADAAASNAKCKAANTLSDGRRCCSSCGSEDRDANVDDDDDDVDEDDDTAAASLPCSNSLQKPHIRRQLFWLISKRVSHAERRC